MNGEPEIAALRSAVKAAVQRFNESVDRVGLLRALRDEAEPTSAAWHAAHERAIAHRLAFYLECYLRNKGIVGDKGPLCVDCEYDRHIGDEKTLRTMLEDKWILDRVGRTPISVLGEPGVFDFLVIPDVILHERRVDDHNLVVLEIKKSSSKEFWRYDDLKLTLFTAPKPKGFNYKLGMVILIRDDLDPAERCLEVKREYPNSSS